MKISRILLMVLLLLPLELRAEQRLISLKPNITDLLFEMGVDSNLVGVTTFCSLPPEHSKISRIADYMHVDLERLLVLKPTLILASEENSLKKDVEFMTTHHINVKVLSFARLDDTFRSIEELGRLVDREKASQDIIAQIQESLKANAVTGVSPRVLMVVGRHPIVVVGSGNFLDDLLKALHATNLAGDSTIRYPTFSVEQLLAARPDVILDLVMGSEQASVEEGRRFYGKLTSLPAMIAGRVYFLDINDFHPSGRLTVGVEKLGTALKVGSVPVEVPHTP